MLLPSSGLTFLEDAIPSRMCTCTGDWFAIAMSNGTLQIRSAASMIILYQVASVHPVIHSIDYIPFSNTIVTLERKAESDKHTQWYLCAYEPWTEEKNEKTVQSVLVATAEDEYGSVPVLGVCRLSGKVAIAQQTTINVWKAYPNRISQNAEFFQHIYLLELKNLDDKLQFITMEEEYVACATESKCLVLRIRTANKKMNEKSRSGTNDESDHLVSPGIPLSSSMAMTTSGYTTSSINKQYMTRRRKNRTPSAAAASSTTKRKSTTIKDSDYLINLTTESNAAANHGSNKFDLNFHGEDLKDKTKDDRLPIFDFEVGHDSEENREFKLSTSMGYQEQVIQVILRRDQPYHEKITTLQFVSESIAPPRNPTNSTKLLLSTKFKAYLNHFVHHQLDRNTHEDSNDPLQNNQRKLQSVVSTIYSFTAPMCSISINSNYLVACTRAGIEIWTLWRNIESRILSSSSTSVNGLLFPAPENPILLQIEPRREIPGAGVEVFMLDAQVLLLEHPSEPMDKEIWDAYPHWRSPTETFELRKKTSSSQHQQQCGVKVYPFVPASQVYASMYEQCSTALLLPEPNRLSFQYISALFLTFLSLFRYQADTYQAQVSLLYAQGTPDVKSLAAKEVQMQYYDSLSLQCAFDLAEIYLQQAVEQEVLKHSENGSCHSHYLNGAATLFSVSNARAADVLHKLKTFGRQSGMSEEHILSVSSNYLQASVFPSIASTGSLTADESLTNIVLEHFGDQAPDEVAHLVIDSCLIWTLSDMALCHARLDKEIRIEDESTAFIRMACLVLLVKACESSVDLWQDFEQQQHQAAMTFRQSCNRSVIQSHIEKLDPFDLANMCSRHLGLLMHSKDPGYTRSTKWSSPTILAQVLFDTQPEILIQCILEIQTLANIGVTRAIEIPVITPIDVVSCLSLVGSFGTHVAKTIQMHVLSQEIDHPSNDNTDDQKITTIYPMVYTIMILCHYIYTTPSVHVVYLFSTLNLIIQMLSNHEDEELSRFVDSQPLVQSFWQYIEQVNKKWHLPSWIHTIGMPMSTTPTKKKKMGKTGSNVQRMIHQIGKTSTLFLDMYFQREVNDKMDILGLITSHSPSPLETKNSWVIILELKSLQYLGR